MTGSLEAHARYRELAAIALDFPLEPAEQAELDAHSDGCEPCRAFATALRRDIAMVATLPEVDTPARVRRRVLGPTVRQPRAPRRPLETLSQAAVLVIGIVPVVLLSVIGSAGASSQLSLEAALRGETTFDVAGQERIVRTTVVLDPVAATRAASMTVESWPPEPSVETPVNHPLHVRLWQLGPDGPRPLDAASGEVDLASCRVVPPQPCTIDIEARLAWNGPVPATAAWKLTANVAFESEDIEAIREASVTLAVRDAESRLPAVVLAALGIGLLTAFFVARRLARVTPSRLARLLRERVPLGLAAALTAASGLLFVGSGPIRPMGYEQELAILLIAQALVLIVVHARRFRDRGLRETLATASVVFGSLPVLLLTVASRQAYRPVEIVAFVVVLAFVAGMALLTRGQIVAPVSGEPLRTSQRSIAYAEVAFATLIALGGVVLSGLDAGWNAWFDQVDAMSLPFLVLAIVWLVAIGRWLKGHSRLLTLLGIVLVIDSVGVFALSIVRRLDHPWLTAGEIIVDFVTEPLGIALIGGFVFGVIAILGRRLHPDSEPAP